MLAFVLFDNQVKSISGQYGPAVAMVLASYTGCNQYLTVMLLTIGMGLNGAIYSGFKVNHLDISPRFAGILMSFTNCLANFAGLIAPNVAGFVIHQRVSLFLVLYSRIALIHCRYVWESN